MSGGSEPELHPQIAFDGKPPGATSWDGSVTEAGTEMRSYYGRPVIKPPVWQPEIAFYLFTGGLGGTAALVSLIDRVTGRERHARRMLYVEFVSDLISPALLTSDLGRPERFINMLRVFKVTSPMSVGSWILVGSNLTSGLAATLEVLDRWKPVKLTAEAGAALLGPWLATYTAALLSNSAVPAWHEARHEMPLLFAAGSAASAGAVGLLVGPLEESGPSRRLAVGGTAVSLVVSQVMEQRLGFVGEPYRKGLSRKLMRGSKLLALAGAGLIATRGRGSRGAAVGGAALLTAGEVMLRWGVFKAGDQSARDPRYTVRPQRERADAHGTKATRRPGERVGVGAQP